MDVRQLRYFHAIAKEGQITRAAKQLNMAQPPLSQQLKQLEEELGVLLFERNGKRMRLTESGKLLYQRAESLLQEMDELVKEIRETGEGIRGVLSIGCAMGHISYVRDRIIYFRDQYPDVTFRVWEGDPQRVSESLEKRDIEIGIVNLPLELGQISMIRLPAEPYVFVIPKQWMEGRLQTVIKIKDIAPFPLVLLRRYNGMGAYEAIVEECNRSGFDPTIIGECTNPHMLVSFVAAGVGATIVPRSVATAFSQGDVALIEIEDTLIQAESAVIWLQDRHLSKIARRFIDTFEFGRNSLSGEQKKDRGESASVL